MKFERPVDSLPSEAHDPPLFIRELSGGESSFNIMA